MKNTHISFLATAMLAAFALLQIDDVAIASSLAPDRFNLNEAPVLLAETVDSDSYSYQGEKVPPDQAGSNGNDPNKIRPLEPAIHNSVKELVRTSHEGLVEEKTSKGVELKLKGRFRTAPVATLYDDGTITVRDYTVAPPTE